MLRGLWVTGNVAMQLSLRGAVLEQNPIYHVPALCPKGGQLPKWKHSLRLHTSLRGLCFSFIESISPLIGSFESMGSTILVTARLILLLIIDHLCFYL